MCVLDLVQLEDDLEVISLPVYWLLNLTGLERMRTMNFFIISKK